MEVDVEDLSREVKVNNKSAYEWVCQLFSALGRERISTQVSVDQCR